MNKYEECLSLAKKQGLFLDDRIERKEVNGLYGMYATKKIPKGTKIASMPKSSLLPEPKDIPSELSDVKWLVAMARELDKGEESSYLAHSMLLETIDEMKNYSAFYFSKEEIDLLSNMSPILGGVVGRFINEVKSDISRVQGVCPDIEEDIVIQAVLNGRSRHWGGVGFIPILDCFNHSEKLGIPLRAAKWDHEVSFVLTKDYEPGEQIWITYGLKDMLVFATNYNYFDPSNSHIVDFGRRSLPILDSPEKLDIAKFTSKFYKVNIVPDGAIKRMFFMEPELYILEDGPNEKLFQYFKKVGFTTMEELKKKKCSLMSATMSYLGTVQHFLGANNVDKYQIEDLPPKLHRFHHALKKEKRMLLANIEWAEKGLKRIKNVTKK